MTRLDKFWMRGSQFSQNSYIIPRSNSRSSNGAGVEVADSSRSFLQDRSKVSGFGDVMSRMSATQPVNGAADSEDQARSLLNRFLGAQVMMTGVESMMANTNGDTTTTTTRHSDAPDNHTTVSQTRTVTTKKSNNSAKASPELVKGVDINGETEETKLRTLLDSCDSYDDRRKVRQRLKQLATDAKGGVSSTGVTVTKKGSGSSLRSNHDSSSANTNKSSYSSSSSFSTTTKTSKVSSPFNKFQQLDAQQHTTRRARE